MAEKSLPRALLVLESGEAFWGISVGAPGERIGEVVFNTSMTGYQEILTDPSYKGQIVLMTEPHIGNVGVNEEDAESARISCEGFILREPSPLSSNWRAQSSLQEYLHKRKVPAIAGIDTRKVTKILRETGVMRGALSTTESDPERLLKRVRSAPAMVGADLVREVTCSKPYQWSEPDGVWEKIAGVKPGGPGAKPFHVVVLDFGVKHNILRCLSARGCRVTVVPAQTSAEEVYSLRPDGVLLSNGPGDPAAVTYAVDTVRRLVEDQAEKRRSPLPVFGICLGHQILGLALGGSTFKLKFGHRSANHPVKNLSTGKVEITTQNHGFCVDIASLKDQPVELTHLNLNDQTLEGLKHKRLPVFSVQYHPESSAGPHDSRYLFDDFLESIRRQKKSQGTSAASEGVFPHA